MIFPPSISLFGYKVFFFCIGSKKNVTFLTACSSIIGTSNYLVWSWKIYHQKMILKEPFSILEVPILRNLTTSSKFLLLQKITLVIAIKAQKYNNMLWIELKDYSKKQVNERIAIQATITKKPFCWIICITYQQPQHYFFFVKLVKIVKFQHSMMKFINWR